MSPRLPRDVSGAELAKLLETFGYAVTRQKGSHLRLTTLESGEHHLTLRAARGHDRPLGAADLALLLGLRRPAGHPGH
jgi:predicted RNA binding protein YcfA (HicA-like mRNA interferase family)